MMKRCLDEGLLQAYLDGELSQQQMSERAAHIASCEACAAALASAESEAAFFANAFGADDSLSVPTEVLRSRIDAAVAQLESSVGSDGARRRGWNFGGFLTALSGLFTFTPQSAAAFAGVLAVVAFAIIYFVAQKPTGAPGGSQTNQQVASFNQQQGAQPVGVGSKSTTESNESNPGGTRQELKPGSVPITSVNYSRPRTGRKKAGGEAGAPREVKEQFLPGEKEYQTAIASLEKTIKLGGDAALRPAVRVDYERNLAILDSAISQTRSVAARNPKDRDAAAFLMSAYQSKVELLTKVADQAQVAALGR